jgi:hypothetical protein
MDTKLTLRLDKDVIDGVKEYARIRNISLSKMVEKYFKSLIEKRRSKRSYSPLVNELSGVINLDENFDFEEDYTRYLVEKYK